MQESSIWANATVSALAGAAGGGLISFVIALVSESRNRYFVKADNVLALIEEVKVDACMYWRRAGTDAALETRIKVHLERVDLRLQGIARSGKARKNRAAIQRYLDELTEAATGGSFEESARRKDLYRVDRVKTLVKEISDLLQ